MTTNRTATVTRKTNETDIHLSLNIDGTGSSRLETGLGFFDHMLACLAKHARFDLELTCKGDLEIDEHHSLEDIGIVFGTALGQAIGDKAGISRFAHALVPLDEALSRVVVDVSGRGFLSFNADFSRDNVGEMSTEMVEEFWWAVATKAGVTIHMEVLCGKNSHHQVESLFKAAARALYEATRLTGFEDVPSTKGVL
ncbi:MAG: imidazoleglycerol-phosphate dehydratase HisB [Gemmatimonadota bacterium]|nr:imidazoleglycerol-phosphate dehydratase HisB [Gemmatimonadota bacterium]